MDSRPEEGVPDSPGPRIIRPIPRRPFNLAFSSLTPPDEDDDYSSPRPQISASDLRFLAPHQHHTASTTSHSRDGSTPLSHTTSYLNLTAPTLSGIYSPSTTSPFTKYDEDPEQYFRDDRDADDTPAPRFGLDEKTYQLMRRRASSSSQQARTSRPFPLSPTTAATTTRTSPRDQPTGLPLALRAALLFALGVGYGALVTRLPHHHDGLPSSSSPAAAAASYYGLLYEWRYLAFWGAAGVVLGTLLPWFDRFWEETAARRLIRGGAAPPARGIQDGEEEEEVDGAAAASPGAEAPVTDKPSAAAAPQADWALVVRGIGAFVGIVFAIRKLPWASTMQVSLTLALANPVLWYLIDRSKPGFLLSAAVGLAGSAVLMGLNPDAMPAPASVLGLASAAGSTVFHGANGTGTAGHGGGVDVAATAAAAAGGLWGLASQETVESGIWMLSVLFCSCVCFGNIGRRLALNSSAAGRGRWGGVR